MKQKHDMDPILHVHKFWYKENEDFNQNLQLISSLHSKLRSLTFGIIYIVFYCFNGLETH